MRRFRQRCGIVLAALLLQLLSGSGWAGGLVLCIEANGHAAIERAEAACCNDEPQQDAAIVDAGSRCGGEGCVDAPLLGPALSSKALALAAPALLATAVAAPAASFVALSPSRLRSAASPLGHSRRSVILLI